MSEMNDEILELVDKHLAKNVGDILKKRLQQADEIEAKLKESEKLLVNQKTRLDTLSDEIRIYKSLEEKYQDLDKKEKNLNELARQLEIEKLKYQLSVEQEKSEFAKNIGLGLVRNIEFRNNISKSYFENGRHTPQGWVDSTSIVNTFEEVKTSK